jgi:CMP-2-keto-3-deoxyoctulosonic acid synthetase
LLTRLRLGRGGRPYFGQTSKRTDRIAEVAKRSKKFSIIVNVQGDEPLVDPRLMIGSWKRWRTNRNVEL